MLKTLCFVLMCLGGLCADTSNTSQVSRYCGEIRKEGNFPSWKETVVVVDEVRVGI